VIQSDGFVSGFFTLLQACQISTTAEESAHLRSHRDADSFGTPKTLVLGCFAAQCRHVNLFSKRRRRWGRHGSPVGNRQAGLDADGEGRSDLCSRRNQVHCSTGSRPFGSPTVVSPSLIFCRFGRKGTGCGTCGRMPLASCCCSHSGTPRSSSATSTRRTRWWRTCTQSWATRAACASGSSPRRTSELSSMLLVCNGDLTRVL